LSLAPSPRICSVPVFTCAVYAASVWVAANVNVAVRRAGGGAQGEHPPTGSVNVRFILLLMS
jgi:hypothetical protein